MNSGEEPPDAVATGNDEPPQIVEGQETGATTAESNIVLCDICGENIPASHYRRHNLRHRATFTCEKCSTSFHDKFALKKHVDIQHNNKVLVCKECGKSFKSYSGFRQHCFIHESKEHTCTTCKLTFANKVKLSHHRRKAHAPQKTCDHLKIHQQAKDHKCTVCTASFKQKQSLKRHLSTHEDPKTCNMCSKSYQGARQLMRHMATVHKNSTD